MSTGQPGHGSYLLPSLEHATVADAMHPGILACDPDAPVTEVARMMATHHVHCIVVMGISDEDANKTLVWGIISDLDLVRAGIRTGAEQTAREIAKDPIGMVDSSTPLRQVAELMAKHSASHVVVTNKDTQRPAGMISTLDIAGVLAWGEG
ncbi:MAG: CBS domain-containing protein [Solirubrobacteraceae bacterium]|jgi:CBS domain-containing protein